MKTIFNRFLRIDLRTKSERKYTMQVNRLEIVFTSFDDAAMTDDRSGEVVRILQNVINQIKDYGVPNLDGKYLKDSNGNRVGRIEVGFTEDDEE